MKRSWSSHAIMVIGATSVVLSSAPALADATNPQGAALLAPFKLELKKALKAGLAEGPDEAVAACQMKAPAIAAVQSVDGVRVGRTSDRLRNPANVSPNWVKPILDAYLAAEGDWAPRTVDLPEERRGYVEPIVMQPLCVQCHGSQIAPDVAERIETLYPNDEATGFEVGDLRGVFYVEYPNLEAAAP